jgi:cytidylate kinase
MIVAIDGPAGVGKSTIAKYIADELNLYYINTGSFYRAATLAVLEKNGDPLDNDFVLETVKSIKLEIINSKVCIDGVDVEDKLHSPQIDKYVSQVSVDPRLRDFINIIIRENAEKMDIIAEGRDITTVVFPNAEHKFYFDASPEVRAKRRIDQHPEGQSYETVLEGIQKRDKNDREKPVGSLKIANDAKIIDTSYLTIKQVCEKVVRAIKTQ